MDEDIMYKFKLSTIESDLISYTDALDKIKKQYEEDIKDFIKKYRGNGKREVQASDLTKHPFSHENYCIREIVFINGNEEKRIIKTLEKNKTRADHLLFVIKTLEFLKQENCKEILSDEQIDDENYYLTKYRYEKWW